MTWFERFSEKGPVTWGLVNGILSGAAVLLAYLSPILLAVSVVALSCAAAGMAVGAAEEAIAERRRRRRYEPAAEPWETQPVRIRAITREELEEEDAAVTAFVRHREAESDRTGRFQERVSVPYQPGRDRLH